MAAAATKQMFEVVIDDPELHQRYDYEVEAEDATAAAHEAARRVIDADPFWQRLGVTRESASEDVVRAQALWAIVTVAVGRECEGWGSARWKVNRWEDRARG